MGCAFSCLRPHLQDEGGWNLSGAIRGEEGRILPAIPHKLATMPLTYSVIFLPQVFSHNHYSVTVADPRQAAQMQFELSSACANNPQSSTENQHGRVRRGPLASSASAPLPSPGHAETLYDETHHSDSSRPRKEHHGRQRPRSVSRERFATRHTTTTSPWAIPKSTAITIARARDTAAVFPTLARPTASRALAATSATTITPTTRP